MFEAPEEDEGISEPGQRVADVPQAVRVAVRYQNAGLLPYRGAGGGGRARDRRPHPKRSLAVVMDILDVQAYEREGYLRTFDWEESRLDKWTAFGLESVHDLRQREDAGN